MNHLKVIFSTAVVTVFLALGLLWVTVELGWLNFNPDPAAATADPLAAESKAFIKKMQTSFARSRSPCRKGT